MTLKEHIEDIRKRLEQNEFTSEAAVRQGIIDRLLSALAWPTYDIKVVFPEYGVEGRKVDYALCHPVEKPRVFIEVKQVGYIEGAERQLFEYAFHSGVPIALLTDGREWRFFYPIGQGEYRERKVHELDLIETDSEESAARLNRYLNYETVQTGDAVKAIEEDYRNVSKQRQIERRLPEAWRKLLQDEDEFSEFLLEAIIGKTESLCGARPATEQVLTFLKSLERKTESDRKESSSHPGPNPRSNTSYRASSTTRKRHQILIVTMPDGTVIKHPTALSTFIEVLETLGLEKVTQVYPRIVSTSPFRHGRHTERGRFYIDHNHDGLQKKRHLEEIAKLLNVTLKIELVDKV